MGFSNTLLTLKCYKRSFMVRIHVQGFRNNNNNNNSNNFIHIVTCDNNIIYDDGV